MNHGPGKIRHWLQAVAVFACLGLVGIVQAQQPPGIPGYFRGAPMPPPYPQYQAPPAAPGTYLRGPNVQQNYARNPWTYPPAPATGQSYPQQPAKQAAPELHQPYVEVALESSKAYVHQNLVMTIRVISNTNLKTISAQLQDSEDFIFRQLGDPTVSTRTVQGQREIVNTVYYQLTPLRGGHLVLEPVQVSGLFNTGAAQEPRYEATAKHREYLRVSEPDPSVQPWLPLYSLELIANLHNDDKIDEGKPLGLVIEQRAVGMSGAQLLSPESQLQSKGYRVYREKTEYQGSISKQGRLVGSRIDRFTLVPVKGNRIEIPTIRFDWWNVERQRKETAVLTGRILNDNGQGFGMNGRDTDQPGISMATWLIWITMLSVAFVLGMVWPLMIPGVKRSSRRLNRHLEQVSRPIRTRLLRWRARLSPTRNLHRLRRYIADNLPRSARLWFCVRGADAELEPADWAQLLRFLISRRLGLPAHQPMARLADQIIEIHPGSDPERIRGLLAELESALFAGQAIADFSAWKKEFKRQVRPRLFRTGKPTARRTGAKPSNLPELNPS